MLVTIGFKAVESAPGVRTGSLHRGEGGKTILAAPVCVLEGSWDETGSRAAAEDLEGQLKSRKSPPRLGQRVKRRILD